MLTEVGVMDKFTLIPLKETMTLVTKKSVGGAMYISWPAFPNLSLQRSIVEAMAIWGMFIFILVRL